MADGKTKGFSEMVKFFADYSNMMDNNPFTQ